MPLALLVRSLVVVVVPSVALAASSCGKQPEDPGGAAGTVAAPPPAAATNPPPAARPPEAPGGAAGETSPPAGAPAPRTDGRRVEGAKVVLLEIDPREASRLDGGEVSELVAFGQAHPAATLCTEDTIMNSDQLEAYVVEGKDAVVVLCPATMDGGANVVTVLTPAGPPRSKQVAPLDSSHRIEDAKLAATAAALMR